VITIVFIYTVFNCC